MVRIFPGDLVAVEADGRYYYAVILDRILLFGGNWCFVFHRTTGQIENSDRVLGTRGEGFHAFVDFIHAKREGRLIRVAKKVEVNSFQACGFLKQTVDFQTEVGRWWIYDMDNRELRTVSRLSDEEQRYPNNETIDDVVMVQRARERWRPELDLRISS